jgi:hypothetical protein
MLSNLSNSAFGFRYYKITGGGGGGPGYPEGAWIGSELPTHAGEGLLYHYDFEGGNANDKSINGNDGTEVGSCIGTGNPKNGTYAINGNNSNRLECASLPITVANGFVMSFWMYPTAFSGQHAYILSLSSTIYLQIENGANYNMRFKPSGVIFNYGAINEWHHFVIQMSSSGSTQVYCDNVLKWDGTVAAPPATVQPKFIFGHKTGKYAFFGDIDDIRVFNTVATAEQRYALSNDLYDIASLKLQLAFQVDASDTLSNYDGTQNGSCIDATRYKYGSKSLTSDGIVASTKYVSMPAVDLVQSMGMTFSFWFYNEAGVSTSDSMLFESKQDSDAGSTLYLIQYKLDRTKFRFGADTGCIVYCATGAWHKIVVTITGGDVVNMWIDDSHDVTDVTVINIMPSVGLDTGWHIGNNITNTGNLCSFDGSIAEFKIWNRVLTATEVAAVV